MKVAEYYDLIIDGEVSITDLDSIILIGCLDFIRRYEVVGGACEKFVKLRNEIHKILIERL